MYMKLEQDLTPPRAALSSSQHPRTVARLTGEASDPNLPQLGHMHHRSYDTAWNVRYPMDRLSCTRRMGRSFGRFDGYKAITVNMPSDVSSFEIPPPRAVVNLTCTGVTRSRCLISSAEPAWTRCTKPSGAFYSRMAFSRS